MANTKKYVSLDKLSLYNEKIKKVITDGDAAALKSAKDYADSLASNYDAAGTAATAAAGALADAKTYADGKDAAIQAAHKAGTDAAAAAGVADGKAVAAQSAADKAQGEVDALETYVGTFTHETAKSVVEYVDAKTAGIASDAALTQLTGRVTTVEGKVATIEGDYLKAADKTELEGKITAEADRAKGIEGGLETRLKAVEDDYLKAADKTELQGNIDTVAGAVERLTNGVSADEIDGVNDLINYVKEHGTEVTGMQEDIGENADAIAAEAERAKGEEAKNAQAAADALKAAQDAQAAADAEAQRATGVEGGLDTRLKAVEAKFGEGEGSVEDQIADAQAAAEATAAADATAKANAAEAAAKTYADGLNTAMDARVDALEAIDHEHANKTELDLIASGDKAKWDAAAAKAHEHSNLSVLEGITSAKVTAWDAAEGNAKTYADGLNTAMNARVETLEGWHENFVECSQEDIQALFA